MSDFIWQNSKFQEIPTLLVSTVSDFRESPEYQKLAEYERDISAVVVGAFAQYLSRLHERKQAGENNVNLDSAITSAHNAVEEMATSSESAILDLVTDEIYENLDCNTEVLEKIREHLKPASLALYDRWKG
jgi:3-hydroxyacyl-CoA dehydrogenase